MLHFHLGLENINENQIVKHVDRNRYRFHRDCGRSAADNTVDHDDHETDHDDAAGDHDAADDDDAGDALANSTGSDRDHTGPNANHAGQRKRDDAGADWRHAVGPDDGNR